MAIGNWSGVNFCDASANQTNLCNMLIFIPRPLRCFAFLNTCAPCEDERLHCHVARVTREGRFTPHQEGLVSGPKWGNCASPAAQRCSKDIWTSSLMLGRSHWVSPGHEMAQRRRLHLIYWVWGHAIGRMAGAYTRFHGPVAKYALFCKKTSHWKKIICNGRNLRRVDFHVFPLPTYQCAATVLK